jgi:RNA-directed DNA polymerase
VFLHEFDDWYINTYRVRPEWTHLASSSLQYRRRKEIGGTLMLIRYADDWVAVWNGSYERAEEIKAEIKDFLANKLKLRLSEEKTLITHIDDGFDFLGYRIQGDKRWADGQWCLFSKVTKKAVKRFREAVKEISRKAFTDEIAAFTALSGLLRGWGNYYAYAAESRLMDSLDAFVYREVWKYCRRKNRKMGAKAVYKKYTLPRPLREVGHFQIGAIVGQRVIHIPRLSSIARKPLKLPYPSNPYLQNERTQAFPEAGVGDEFWWDRQIWIGQEGLRKGQKRLAAEVLARDKICRICGKHPAVEAHHIPQWKDTRQHDPKKSLGVCSECHRQIVRNVGKSNGEPR